jgi:hypothetical protein
MVKATYLGGLFLTGCVASSFLGMLATLHPVFLRAVILVGCLVGIAWIAAWCLDDWAIEHWQLHRMSYYSVLVLVAIAVLLGVGVSLWIVW